MKTFAEKIIEFNSKLKLDAKLPSGISVMNPFAENIHAVEASSNFYRKFYNDNNKRYLILGINPGRFGAGVTGIPFTDSKRLQEKCGIIINGIETHEPSAVFVYDVIDKFGGPKKFYFKFYINSICPLGFTIRSENGREINYNYYDNSELTEAVYPFMIDSLKKQIAFGIDNNICFCLGTGKNFKFISKVNEKYNFFEKIIPLEHPRYVMQYKSKQKQLYIRKYLRSINKL